MHLAAYRLRNFRRLENVRVDLEKDVSVFVGANNSGKTSATVGVRMFVSANKSAFSVHDFSSACWKRFEAIAADSEKQSEPLPSMSLDLWFHIEDADLYRVVELLPSLDWDGTRVGIRIEFAPRDQAELLDNYGKAAKAARDLADSQQGAGGYTPWPKGLIEYLEKNLSASYAFRYYALDATKFSDDLDPVAGPDDAVQLPEHGDVTGRSIIESLILVDFLDAQRPFSTEDGSGSSEDLSQRLSQYYKHLKQHTADFGALQALAESERHLNDHFKSVFGPTIASLEEVGYSGFDNPQLTIKSVLSPEALLAKHGSGARVHYSLPGVQELTLPDRYNGLGYKNLIYMIVELLEMHAKWLAMTSRRPPLHIVFIEEPEAHLHTQLQQVFIKQISEIPALKASTPYLRQLVVTTHSPHILYQHGFSSVRYFRRQPAQTAQVLNLTGFERSSPKENLEFLRKYVKLTHCDLFFADATILVEGNVERLLLPFMIKKLNLPELTSSHLSVIEVSGAFAHRFRGLLEFLGIPALIITDLDSVQGTNHRKKCRPDVDNAVTCNQILLQWLPGLMKISELLAASSPERTSPKAQGARGSIHVTYQGLTNVSWNDKTTKQAARTLEEAFALENLSWVQNSANGAIGLYIENNATMELDTLLENLYQRVADEDFKKTDFALAVLASPDEQWAVPGYIENGLRWLAAELRSGPPPASTPDIELNASQPVADVPPAERAEIRPRAGTPRPATRKPQRSADAPDQLDLWR